LFWAKFNIVGFPRRRAVALALALVGVPGLAAADQLAAEQRSGETGYVAVEELSYETIIDASPGYAAELRVRVALHNGSESDRDVVQSLALPFASQVTGVAVARDGVWTQGKATVAASEPDRRDPGTVYVRELGAASDGDIPGAEIVAFAIEPGATIQAEVTVRIFPRLRGERWELDLPARGVNNIALAGERRVIVRGLGKDEHFEVDGSSNAGHKYMITRPEDTVTVSWPSHLKARKSIEAHLEVVPGPPGFDDGEFRLYLRLGQTAPMKPDHVIVLVDRSMSTDDQMERDAMRMVEGLFHALPAGTTFDALAFNRTVVPLMDERPRGGRVGNAADRKALAESLADAPRGQGSNIEAALGESARRARKVRGKTLIVVATDGMFPSQMSPAAIDRAFDLAKGPRQPEVLFVIDEPMLQRSGIGAGHPIARVAAQLGARISLETMGQLEGERAKELLGAPRVLGGLGVELPKNAKLVDDVPAGLVAGSFVLLRGRYLGKAPGSVHLLGHFGDKSVRRAVKSSAMERSPEALAAVTTGDVEDAVTEGYARPPWYRSQQEKDARRGIMRAGRHGHEQKGYLDSKIFRHYLTTRVLPRARVCYNRALTRHPFQGGRVVLEMEIGKGEVMLARTKEADLSEGDTKLLECMTEAAWALDIPAGKLDDQVYRLRYPLRLIPPEDGKSAGEVTQLSDDAMELLLSG
jgi:hypothetical protein